MKKIIAICVALLFIATIGASVSAKVPVSSTIYGGTNLYEKDPSTWEVVEGGAYGFFIYVASGYYHFSQFIVLDVIIRCKVIGLNADTEYAIITYHEDWPNFDLIHTETTDYSGSFIAVTTINDIPYDKVWVVPTSGLNLVTEQFLSWNPTEILFENNLL